MSVLPAVLGTLLVVVPAFCASAGGEVDHKAQLWDFAWRLLNFAILVYILYKLAWKRLVSFFRNRREDIKTSLAEANDRKVEAEEKFKEYEVKLTKATDDIQNISEMIKAQGLAEKQKLIADAEKAAEKMKEDAKARMEQEMKKAGSQLRTEAVELSIKVAEDILKRNVSQEDHEKMVKEYMDRMVKEN
ncbi:MAG TPA: F0F1 ATP synthase subunit B [Syntrophales bacterium]|nr:F0F1 ATP synthase subunit B [Syntrophales bacterium]HPI57772.1 F0F1 ATP synthase subunit B [Syntrophales bacterium]HPN25818.1 F0F1 ATP synthase subunit B [Syntrophales bacterium]HQM30537.1 F0F1 ATP synthase subunit B [Syntrophales bacterium]